MKENKFDIIEKTFQSEPTHRIPYALWKHFVGDDKTPEGLANAQLTFQKRFDSDIMKISPHGSYCVVDFGGQLGGYKKESGSRICVKPPIETINDWETLEPIDPNDGEFGKQIRAVELIHHEVENEVPTMMTVFSPFMVASKLDPQLLNHLNEQPDLIADQLKMITKIMTEFTVSSLDAGADGIFLATQHFNDKLTEETRHYLEFKLMEELIIKGLKKNSFLVLHLHGEKPDFNKAVSLPSISAINWHDQHTQPSLSEARKIFKGAIMGGFNTDEWRGTVSEDSLEHKITEVYEGFSGWGFIFSPGCVIPQFVTDDTITKVVKIVKKIVVPSPWT